MFIVAIYLVYQTAFLVCATACATNPAPVEDAVMALLSPEHTSVGPS